MMSARIRRARCRSPHGERGLKYPKALQRLATRGRSPHGERGLKFWRSKKMSATTSRSPHGERGLKLRQQHPPPVHPGRSLPTRGAWIEIRRSAGCPRQSPGRSPHGERGLKFCVVGDAGVPAASLPTRGAWIEIGSGRGRRHRPAVAPHTGSVD